MTIHFFSGYHGSGKSFAANILKSQGYEIFDSGPIIRSLHSEAATIQNFGEWVGTGESKYGKNFTNQVIANEICNRILTHPLRSYYNSIVIGFRSFEGVEYIQSKILELMPDADFRIVYFDCSENTLYKRWTKREKINIPLEEFLLLLQKETLSGLPCIKERADIIISNKQELTRSELESQLLACTFG
ncbi:MAG: hypothetical protein ACRCXZ_09095 [Patescibacteria group bacterium]